jgi:TolB-like protein/DNA-binding winged helix-turn-helix (wHTH) protein/Tfp pilus assembly protein PilF
MACKFIDINAPLNRLARLSVIESGRGSCEGVELLRSSRFGVFELDPSVPELRRNGRRVHLQEMPLRVLEMLLERPQELVPRDVFFSRLWPHDHSGILDDNLNTAIRKLRLALDDSAHHPRFIETVPRRGYRFVAPVSHDEEAAVSEPLETRAAQTEKPGTRVRLAPALVVIAVTGVISATALVLHIREDTTPEAAVTATNEEIRTLAVLPFLNASGNPADEYFSDGLTEELTDSLSRSGDLRVVSRTSAFSLKGKGIGAQEIGRILGVDSLVEGSVRRDGKRLRISVHLVDAGNGYQLWSETYDRRMNDVFEVQQEIALSVANTLTGRLPGPAGAGELAVQVTDAVAYDLYLKGRFYWHRRTAGGLHSAVEYFEEAVARAPDYAPVQVGLGDAYAVLGFYDYLPPEEAFPKAQAAARRALELDPDNAPAQATLGYAALYYDWDLEEAESRFLRSIELDPGYSKARQWYANLLTAAGRFDEAEREMRRAQQLEPLSLIASAALGWVHYFAGEPELALEQYRLTLGLDPDFELAYLWSGWALEELGKYDEALEMLEEAVARSGGSGISKASLARLHALRGGREEAERHLAELLGSEGYVPSYEISKAWYALGKPEEASEWLQRALEQRSHSLVFLRVDPQLAAQQGDASFVRLLARVGPEKKR